MEALWLEDQRIQRDWDRFLCRRPACSLCGGAILDDRALKLEDHWYCADCVRRQTREVDGL